MDNEADLTTAANLPEIGVAHIATRQQPQTSTMDNEAYLTTAANPPEIDVAHITARQQSKKKYYGQ